MPKNHTNKKTSNTEIHYSVNPKIQYYKINITIPKTHAAYGFCGDELPLNFPTNNTQTLYNKKGQTFTYTTYTDNKETAKNTAKHLTQQLENLTQKDIIEYHLNKIHPWIKKHLTLKEPPH